MYELSSIAMAAMKTKDRVGKLAAAFRAEPRNAPMLRDLGDGVAARRRARRGCKGQWTSAFEKHVRDHIRTYLSLDRCTSDLAIAVCNALVVQRVLWRQRHDRKQVTDPLATKAPYTPNKTARQLAVRDRGRAVVAAWCDHLEIHPQSMELDPVLGVGHDHRRLLVRTEAGVVVLRPVGGVIAWDRILADALRARRALQVVRTPLGAAIVLDGKLCNVADALVQLGLATQVEPDTQNP